jgi:hypothetical protein
MQTQLPLLLVLTAPAKTPEPKVEPHRNEMDVTYAAAIQLTRECIECPSTANMVALCDAVRKAHVTLQALSYYETKLAEAQ